MQTCLFSGQIISSLVLTASSTGASVFTVLYGVFAGTAILATLGMALLRPHHEMMRNGTHRTEGAAALLLSTTSLLVKSNVMQLLTLSNIAFGLCSGLQNGAFVTQIVQKSVGTENIGYVFAINYLGMRMHGGSFFLLQRLDKN